MDKIEIYTEFITLGQFLKLYGAINNGGEAKKYLETGRVSVNFEPETRRGRKLYPSDVVGFKGKEIQIVKKDENRTTCC